MKGLGNIAFQQGDYASALEQFKQAFEESLKIEVPPFALDALLGIARWLVQDRQYQRGVALLGTVLRHPAASQNLHTEARKQIYRLKTLVSPQLVEQILTSSNDTKLERSLIDGL